MITWQQYLGMRVEGRLRDHLVIGGKHEDAVLLGLLSDEYRSTALPKMNALIAAARSDASGAVA
jgi:diamine N-acetyltransferase